MHFQHSSVLSARKPAPFWRDRSDVALSHTRSPAQAMEVSVTAAEVQRSIASRGFKVNDAAVKKCTFRTLSSQALKHTSQVWTTASGSAWMPPRLAIRWSRTHSTTTSRLSATRRSTRYGRRFVVVVVVYFFLMIEPTHINPDTPLTETQGDRQSQDAQVGSLRRAFVCAVLIVVTAEFDTTHSYSGGVIDSNIASAFGLTTPPATTAVKV